MRKACFYVHSVYYNNEIFNLQSWLNRDNCLDFFYQLKQEFLKHGIQLDTNDLCAQEEAEFVIFNEMPKDQSAIKYPEKSIVLLFESELIRPDNWNLDAHKNFKLIFTWNDKFIDNKKYFKFNFTHSDRVNFFDFEERKKLCTLIAGNKRVDHPLELYSKRVEAIRWFEKNYPNDFEFYGVGWDFYTFNTGTVVGKILNRLTLIRKILSKEWPLYKGKVDQKLEVLKKYKFSICYENARDIPGYITEKVLDSLAAGCIPIYWGAPNIEDYIPKECFVDMRDFNSYESLYINIKTMTKSEYNKRLQAIEAYLKSPKHQLFESKYNASQIVQKVISANSR